MSQKPYRVDWDYEYTKPTEELIYEVLKLLLSYKNAEQDKIDFATEYIEFFDKNGFVEKRLIERAKELYRLYHLDQYGYFQASWVGALYATANIEDNKNVATYMIITIVQFVNETLMPPPRVGVDEKEKKRLDSELKKYTKGCKKRMCR